jgi:hypothetical protein
VVRTDITHRLIVSILIAATAGFLSYRWFSANPGYFGGDFTYAWRAAGHLLEGRDPYLQMLPGAYGLGGPFLYPLPTAIVTLPFALLPVHVAASVFFSVTVAVLAFVLTRTNWWPLLMFLSAAFVTCVTTAQWSPLLVSAALWSGTAWAAVAKPNLALAAFAYNPHRSMILGALVLSALGLLLVPAWPAEWFDHIGMGRARHEPIAFTPIGAFVLLGLLRWRTSEGRLIVALGCVPTAAWPYDHLLLWLTAKTWKEAALLTVTSWFVYLTILATAPHDLTRDPSVVQSIIALGLYLPALAFVLRRPNHGVVPGWIERAALRLPQWLRGSALAS